MELRDRDILVLGGAGLVGQAVARRILEHRPRRLVIASLAQREAESAVAELRAEPGGAEVVLEPVWGDIFVPLSLKDRSREEILREHAARRLLIDDLYGELTEGAFLRSTLAALLLEARPHVVVDCVNAAGVLAYQNAFASAAELRALAERGEVDPESVERHLATQYLPQLIRHCQIALEALKRAGTEVYLKVGTAGTGGLGLNIPFTHSEERPSRLLLAKAGLAGAHTLFLYLMARTPGAPAVKEIKPTAAISWKAIGFGEIGRGGRPLERCDATAPLPLEEAFRHGAGGYARLGQPLRGVYLDAGENGLFSLPEFESLTALGLMEYVTPEEIAEDVIREIRGQPSGHDVIAALDASTFGPTYRAGVLRGVAIERMEALERAHGVQAIAYEMLGPPRLSKLLFEGAILGQLFPDLKAVAALDPQGAARAALEVVNGVADLRQRALSIGLPILLPDGRSLLRGAHVKVEPPQGWRPDDARIADRGWIDLRPVNWRRWRERAQAMVEEIDGRPGPDRGSRADIEPAREAYAVRPGRMAAWIFRFEDGGLRIKR
ncbi:MAG: short-chain dehydrogenase [Gemmatimonadetes bacterium]|nr:short-chain dehydrogenase [Gemmatimonadota bacterium]